MMLGLMAFPLMAQHGSARGGSGGHAAAGGFGGHAGFAARGSFGGFAPRGGGFAPRASAFAPRGIAPRGFAGPARPGFAPRYGQRMIRAPYQPYGYGPDRFRGGDHHRRPYDRGFNEFNGYPYNYAYSVWPAYPIDLDPWLFTPDDWDDDSAQAGDSGNVPAPYPQYGQPEPGPQGYGYDAQPYPSAEQGYEAPPASVQPRMARQPYTGASAATPQEAVTLIFKDGRAPETIHNFMLTADSLTVLDGAYQRIPLDQIDVAATQSANRAAGISFEVPGSSN